MTDERLRIMRLFKQCGSHCIRAGGAGLAIPGSTFSSAFLSFLMDVVLEFCGSGWEGEKPVQLNVPC